jgi:hypothetical protein
LHQSVSFGSYGKKKYLRGRPRSDLPRALKERKTNVDEIVGNAETTWEYYVGGYAPAANARNIAEVTKQWTFQDPADPDKCTVEVGRVA